MKVCFALLVDYKLHNYARKIAFDINKKYNTGFIASRLPQHVTLGPTFEIEDIKEVEGYFDSLVKGLEPFELTFTNIDLKIIGDDNDGFGVLWMTVEENDKLRELHNEIYRDIEKNSWRADEIFGDGVYYFHSTISLGNQLPRIYKEIYINIENKEINYTCTIEEIALFCPSDNENKMGTYITYKRLPLGVKVQRL